MPALVIRDLIAWLADQGGSVAAGARYPGLDRGVEGVLRYRRIASRDFQEVEPHDVIMISYDILENSSEVSLDTLVSMMADTQAALMVAGLPSREQARDLRPYETADARAFPLIALPSSTNLATLARDTLDVIRRRQVQSARTVRDTMNMLATARRSDTPLEALSQAIAIHTGLAFLLEDEHRTLLYHALPLGDSIRESLVQEAFTSYAARQAVRPATPQGVGTDIPVQRHLPEKMARAIVPLESGTAPIAYLSLLGPDTAVTPFHVDILWQVAPAFAFELGKLRKEQTDTRRTASEDFLAILSGTLSEGDALRRSLQYGHDLSLSHAIATVLPGDPSLSIEEWMNQHSDMITPEIWAGSDKDGLHIIMTDYECTEDGINRFLQRLNGVQPVCVGIGRVGIGIEHLIRSRHDAVQAARASMHLHQRYFFYDRLGVMRLLSPLQELNVLEPFSHEILDNLLNADAHHSESLLVTLNAWFEVNGNMTEAARRLHVHRNTLIYRLNRIQDVLGYSLDDADARLSLHLAIKIWYSLHRSS